MGVFLNIAIETYDLHLDHVYVLPEVTFFSTHHIISRNILKTIKIASCLIFQIPGNTTQVSVITAYNVVLIIHV